MGLYQVRALLDPEPKKEAEQGFALDKLASLLGTDPEEQEVEFKTDDALKTASVMEKLGRALESGQAQLDDELRELFGGDETDEDIMRHNEIEDDYLDQTGQPGV